MQVVDSEGKKIKIIWTKLEEISEIAKQKFTIFGKDIKA